MGREGPLELWTSVDLEADRYESLADEPLGTKDKFWVEDPSGVQWLFKFARDRGGVVRGEDWAEWCVFVVASFLEIPVAHILPATCKGKRGSLSRKILSDNAKLVHGNELLQRSDSGYDGNTARQNPGYSVVSIKRALANVAPPAECQWEHTATGFDVLASYLGLDALVAGRDRHHLNWAAIEDQGSLCLAPSFDHGNALGFQEGPESLHRLISSDEAMKTWAGRGKSHHFGGKPTLVEIAKDAMGRTTAGVAEEFRNRLVAFDMEVLYEPLDSVPNEIMSVSQRMFVVKLIELNRRRLLDGCQADFS